MNAIPDLVARLEPEIEARERLQRELDLRDRALDASQAHFLIAEAGHPGYRIVYVNRVAAEDHGYTVDELLGQNATTLAAVDLCPESIRRVTEATAAGEELRTEVLARRKDGTTFRAGVFLAPIRDAQNRVTHYVSIGANVTARLKAEQTRQALQERLLEEMRERERMAEELRVAQKLEAIGQLAAGIAHEINTPIQYVGDSVIFLQSVFEDIRTLVDVLRAELLTAVKDECAKQRIQSAEEHADLEFLSVEVPKAFERTREGIRRVANIVRAMKEFAHPDAKEQRPADINQALETTLTVARNEYKFSAVIEKRFGDLPEVICNISELDQVFLNLIVNAAHAIQESGQDVATGRITIGTSLDRDFVRITIADNGCGISEANRSKIFDPFFTTKEVGKGSGQGLSIARSIVVDEHGGRIEVDSTLGKGTKFTIHVPVGGRIGMVPA